jgi:NADP-dependent 3-hydroxy acid dehydrogenase YdfG
MTRALLPALRASGAGDVLFMGSTAGLISYEGGASYTAAKHGVHTLADTLRLELCGEPVRVIVIAPGMVRTDEFAVNRTGSQEKADAIYRGVREPLVAEDVADCVAWCLTRPHHVNVDLLVVRPLAQAAQWKVAREE